MSEEYVRKDTLEATMREIRALMSESEARHRAEIAEIRGEIAEIRGEVKAINAKTEGFADTFTIAIGDITERLSSRERVLGCVFTLMGLSVTLSAIIVAGLQVYLAVRG